MRKVWFEEAWADYLYWQIQEKKKLASLCDFLVFCLRKIMLNVSGKVDSQFFCSLHPVSCQAFTNQN